jgi:hypothetical protein
MNGAPIRLKPYVINNSYIHHDTDIAPELVKKLPGLLHCKVRTLNVVRDIEWRNYRIAGRKLHDVESSTDNDTANHVVVATVSDISETPENLVPQRFTGCK